MAFDYELTPREKARLDAVCDKLISDAAAEGLTVDRNSLLTLPSVRMAVLTDLGLDDRAMAEVKRIPAVAAQVHRNEVNRQLADGTSEIHADISRLNPWQKLSLGRELEQARAAASVAVVGQKAPMTAEEEARAILALRQIKNPADRLAAARQMGLA